MRVLTDAPIVIGVGVALGLGILLIQGLSIAWVLVLAVAGAGATVALVRGDARRILLALILLDIPLQLDMHLFYRPEAELMGMRGGVNVSLTTLCLLLLVGPWMIRRATPGTPSPPIRAPTILLSAYLVISAGSALVAQDWAYSAFELSLMIPAFLVHLYIATEVENERDLVFVWMILLSGVVLEASLMILTSVFGQELSFFGGLSTSFAGSADETGFRRAEGTLRSPIVAASYLVLLLAPAAGIAISRVPRSLRRVALVAVLTGGVALILTLSRAAWLGGLLSLGILAIFSARRGWVGVRHVLLSGLVLMGILLASSEVVVTRLLGPDEGSAYSRIPLMKIAFEIIGNHPFLGVGINNLGLAMSEFRVSEFGGAWLHQVHNKYLLVWAETGTVGLVAFVAFLAATFWTGIRVVRTGDPSWAAPCLGLVAALAAHCLHMLVDGFTGRAQVQLLWVAAAVLVATLRVTSQPRPDIVGPRDDH